MTDLVQPKLGRRQEKEAEALQVLAEADHRLHSEGFLQAPNLDLRVTLAFRSSVLVYACIADALLMATVKTGEQLLVDEQ